MFQYSNQPISNSSRGQARHGRERKSAIHTVLTTPKLLSHILSLLPIKDLLISAQRVNRTWNNVIENTTPLQASLFITSSSSTTPRILNPLLKNNWLQWCLALTAFEWVFYTIWRKIGAPWMETPHSWWIGLKMWPQVEAEGSGYRSHCGKSVEPQTAEALSKEANQEWIYRPFSQIFNFILC